MPHIIEVDKTHIIARLRLTHSRF